MKIFKHTDSLNAELQSLSLPAGGIGLVPTMGNLHEGHIALIAQAKQHCAYVLSTIFVNPLQFGPSEDFERYPRTFAEDCEQLSNAGCDAVFVPGIDEMYPNGTKNQTIVSVPSLSALYCGASRPGHFSGVCTVVNKLFNLTRPDLAFFGAKDFQQLLIIKKMVKDLCMPISIMSVPTQRAESGLALSSRNSFLSPEDKDLAAELYAELNKAKTAILNGQCKAYAELETASTKALGKVGMEVDYFAICNANTLQPATPADTELVILAAVYIGRADHKTRLIDNVTLALNTST